MRQKDEHLCFHCNQPGHLKKIVQNCLTVPSAESEDMCQLDAPTNHSETDLHVKLLKSPGINGRGPRIYHISLIEITDVFTVQETIKPEIVKRNDSIRPQPLTILLVVQVLPHTIMHKTYNLAHHHNLTHGHQLTISTVNPLYMFKHQPSWLMDHNSS